jgi:hypothetical protein
MSNTYCCKIWKKKIFIVRDFTQTVRLLAINVRTSIVHNILAIIKNNLLIFMATRATHLIWNRYYFKYTIFVYIFGSIYIHYDTFMSLTTCKLDFKTIIKARISPIFKLTAVITKNVTGLVKVIDDHTTVLNLLD